MQTAAPQPGTGATLGGHGPYRLKSCPRIGRRSVLRPAPRPMRTAARRRSPGRRNFAEFRKLELNSPFLILPLSSGWYFFWRSLYPLLLTVTFELVQPVFVVTMSPDTRPVASAQ